MVEQGCLAGQPVVKAEEAQEQRRDDHQLRAEEHDGQRDDGDARDEVNHNIRRYRPANQESAIGMTRSRPRR